MAFGAERAAASLIEQQWTERSTGESRQPQWEGCISLLDELDRLPGVRDEDEMTAEIGASPRDVNDKAAEINERVSSLIERIGHRGFILPKPSDLKAAKLVPIYRDPGKSGLEIVLGVMQGSVRTSRPPINIIQADLRRPESGLHDLALPVAVPMKIAESDIGDADYMALVAVDLARFTNRLTEAEVISENL